MIILCVIAVFVSIGYVYLIHHITLGWNETQNIKVRNVDISDITISVIIAARNEENYIQNCIESIFNNNFPVENFEIVIVDDHSTDKTFEIISQNIHKNVRFFSLPENLHGKKAAITFGVSVSRFPYILCTDADSVVSKDWLSLHGSKFKMDDTVLNTSVVLPETDDTILSHFQFLDFVATMAITANGIFRKTYFLANGANISFKKAAFYAVKGYEGNEHLASGDDVFLVNKIALLTPEKIGFLKSSVGVVTTKSEISWSSLIQQRKRWATKSLKMGDNQISKIQAFIFIYCVIILLFIFVGLFYSGWLLTAGLVALLIKMATDYYFLNSLCRFFDKNRVMRSFLPCFFLYFIHILLSGMYALIPSDFDWKGREVR
ncbi:MAG: glycosyltransferase [Saprospiraceae bacterium]|nr:glycosyltransferase [Saprospiraceae bacterium]